MIEIRGNLWAVPADIRVITTNGTVKKNGECVMGRGCAYEAKQRWPELPKRLGDFIKAHGNVVGVHTVRYHEPSTIVSFPVKHEWHQAADPELIRVSAMTLRAFADSPDHDWQHIVMPRPGCGNGRLRWEDVKPILEPFFDDRFQIITF